MVSIKESEMLDILDSLKIIALNLRTIEGYENEKHTIRDMGNRIYDRIKHKCYGHPKIDEYKELVKAS